MIKIGDWPVGTLSAFVIRDDDINSFTEPRRLDDLYRDLFAMGFKVTFGVVPAVRGVDVPAIPPEQRKSGSCYELTGDVPIVRWLGHEIRNRNAAAIMHGLHHTDNPTISAAFLSSSRTRRPALRILQMNSEFYGLDYSGCVRRIWEGQAIMERELGHASVGFIPPQEYVSPALYLALQRAGLPSIGGLTKEIAGIAGWRDIDFRSLAGLVDRAAKTRNPLPRRLLESLLSKLPHIYPNYRHHYPNFSNEESAARALHHAKEEFDRAYTVGDYFITVTHHWEYYYDWSESVTSTFQKRSLYELLSHVKTRPRTWSCTLDELISWIRARKSVTFRRSGDGVKLKSITGCNGLTLWFEPRERRLAEAVSADVREYAEGVVALVDLHPGVVYRLG